jgi:ribosomal protein L31E
MVEKKLTIGIDVKGKNFNHKAKHGMTAFKVELKKHFRNKECVISTAINELIWGKGRVNCPSKVSFVSIEKNNKVYLFLETKEDQKRMEELISGKTSADLAKNAKPAQDVKSTSKKDAVLTQKEVKPKAEKKEVKEKKETKAVKK